LAIQKIQYANRNTPAVALATNKCIVDYEITDINNERSELYSSSGDTRKTNNNGAYDYYITPNDNTNANQVLTGIWDHVSGGEMVRSFWIRAVVYHQKIGDGVATPKNQKAVINTGTIVLLSEIKFWVNFIDPCIRSGLGASNSIVAPLAISDMVYVRNGHPAAT
jgi:hypothetical protein